MVRLTAIAGALASIPLLFAHPQGGKVIVGRDENGRGGCLTRPTEEFLSAAAGLAGGRGSSSFSTADFKALAAGDPTYDIKIKMWFHVVAESTALEDGYIPDEQLYDQLDVVNENYGQSTA
jgi:hypothetical protein